MVSPDPFQESRMGKGRKQASGLLLRKQYEKALWRPKNGFPSPLPRKPNGEGQEAGKRLAFSLTGKDNLEELKNE